MGSAMHFLKVSIQGPGRGSHRVQTGNSVISSQGRAMPAPSIRKTAIASAAGWATA